MKLARPPSLEQYPRSAAIASGDRLVELVEQALFDQSTAEPYRLFLKLTPKELFAVSKDESPAHQLAVGKLRFPVGNWVGKPESMFLHSFCTQLKGKMDELALRTPGSWRVVGARPSASFRARFARRSTGLSPQFVQRMDDAMDPDKPRQLTEGVEVRDPVIDVEFAFAEITGAKPIDAAWAQYGSKASIQYAWIEGGCKMRHMPPRYRQQRDLAMLILASMGDFDPAEIEADITWSPEAEERAKKLIEFGLSDEEIAGAVGIPTRRVGEFRVPAKKEKSA